MPAHIRLVETILYVYDQELSTTFYSALFRQPPDLHVPGMTEFIFSESSRLGLMPNDGIATIISGPMPHPATGNGIPRCELYLYVADVQQEYDHALACGAVSVSPPADRNWGDRAAYLADPDGHIIAFAQKIVP